jgi:hypothetical protein
MMKTTALCLFIPRVYAQNANATTIYAGKPKRQCQVAPQPGSPKRCPTEATQPSHGELVDAEERPSTTNMRSVGVATPARPGENATSSPAAASPGIYTHTHKHTRNEHAHNCNTLFAFTARLRPARPTRRLFMQGRLSGNGNPHRGQSPGKNRVASKLPKLNTSRSRMSRRGRPPPPPWVRGSLRSPVL